MLQGPINVTGYARVSIDRTPINGPDLNRYGAQIGYPEACKAYLALRALTKRRPVDIADSPVINAWLAVLAVEWKLLAYARNHHMDEAETYRYFVRQRGKGIPRSPHWQLALRQAREALA